MSNQYDPFIALLGHKLAQDQEQRRQQQLQQNAMQQQLYQQNLQSLQQRELTGGTLQGSLMQMLAPGLRLGLLANQAVTYPEHWNDDPYWKEYMLECQRELREWDEALGIDQTGR